MVLKKIQKIFFWKNILFQEIINNRWAQLDWFYDFTFIFIVYIIILVGGFLFYIIISKWRFKEFIENRVLETLWTFFPIFILRNIGIFRIIILYNHEIEDKSFLRIKIIGHQWYWTYNYTDFSLLEYDRYITPINELLLGENRLLEVDNNIVVPIFLNNRLIVNRADVLHSWTIPSLGVKIDANPGRLNIIFLKCLVIGKFFGQCSEICGANHSFIPICLETNSLHNFKNWVNKF